MLFSALKIFIIAIKVMSVQTVDPRIALELEKLNNSCEKINNLEVNLGKKNFYKFSSCVNMEIPILHPHPQFTKTLF